MTTKESIPLALATLVLIILYILMIHKFIQEDNLDNTKMDLDRYNNRFFEFGGFD